MKKKVQEQSNFRIFRVVVGITLGLIVMLFITAGITKVLTDANKLSKIPAPELSEGMRGELGIDKNVNEETIDNYLNRSDSVYRDMRMLVDPANYEAIGGDRYLSGYVDGFEVVPLPYLIAPEGLPEAVGKSYAGNTLFKKVNGKYITNYKESIKILKDLFPKDKNIFLMCGGGGYAGMTKALLVSLGWDENKIWNVGGYWYYEGKNKVELKDGNTYAFWKAKYHNIDFNTLTKE
jgi:rhodanese-related sulfurtransferase